MWMYSDDPVRDARHRDDEYEEWLDSRPVCDECHEAITGELMWEIGTECFCEDCINSFRKFVD